MFIISLDEWNILIVNLLDIEIIFRWFMIKIEIELQNFLFLANNFWIILTFSDSIIP